VGSRLLYQRGIIRNGLCFVTLAKAVGHGKHASGDYVCDVGMSSKLWV